MRTQEYNRELIQDFAKANCKKMTAIQIRTHFRCSESTFLAITNEMHPRVVFKRTPKQRRRDKAVKYILKHNDIPMDDLAKKLKTTKATVKGIRQKLRLTAKVINMKAPEVHLGGIFNVNARHCWL